MSFVKLSGGGYQQYTNLVRFRRVITKKLIVNDRVATI